MSEDLRVLKTKKAIKEAFISLVEEKGYSHVLIKDITTRAMINKNTFYLHYYNKEDLISKIVLEVLAEQEDEIKTLSKSIMISAPTKIEMLFKNLLLVIKEQIEFYRIILTEPSLSGYIGKLKDVLRKTMVDLIKLDTTITVHSYISIEYIISGVFGVIERWITKDFASVDDISKTLSKICIASYVTTRRKNK